jgi:hypothetical protein
MSSDMPLTLPQNHPQTGGYSASVEIELHTESCVLHPTHTADDRLIFAHPQSIQPSKARLIIIVDGEPRESTIEILPYESPSACCKDAIPE